MANQFTDRAYEDCAVIGTGDVTLSGAKTGYVPIPQGDSICLIEGVVDDNSTGQWEVSQGVRTGSIFVRNTVVASSNSGNLVDFTDPTEIALVVSSAYFEAINLRLDTNEGNIATNAANIATNVGNITDNADQIALNLSQINTNVLDIASNTTAIDNKENELGNPAIEGDALISSVAGVRSWITLVKKFTDLSDTLDYTGQAGNLVKVNPTEDGLTYGSPSGVSVDWGDIGGILANQTDLQTALDAKADIDHTQPATSITYDPTNDPTSSETDVQAALVDHGTSIEERLSSNSGAISGGRLSGSGATFNVTDGVGKIYDSYTNPENTSILDVVWSGLNSITIQTNGLSAGTIRVFIDSSGLTVQTTDPQPLHLFRQNIFLGAIFFVGGVISETFDAPTIIKQTATDLTDELVRDIEISGGSIEPVTNQLQIWLTDAIIFYPGINWYVDKLNPNIASIPQIGGPTTPAPFYRMTQTGLISAQVQNIPVDYNPTGDTITDLPFNDATIHRLYSVGVGISKATVLLYGQIAYSDSRVAKDNLRQDEDLTVFPAEVDHMFFLGWICVEGNAPDFNDINDAWIVSNVESGGNSTTSASFDHTILFNRDVSDQHPIESIGVPGDEQLRTTLDAKTQWMNVWQSQEYLANQMVLDGNWTMIANTTTTDRASPQPTGDPAFVFPDDILWVDTTLSGDLLFGYEFNPTGISLVSGWRIWITSSGNNYTVQLWDMNNPATPVLIGNADVGSGNPVGWLEVIGIGDLILQAQSKYRLLVIVHPELNDTHYQGLWRYLNSGVIPSAGVVLLNSETEIHISYTEVNTGPDRKADLLLLKYNDTITFTQTSDDGRAATYRLTADSIDTGQYIVLQVVLQSSTGLIQNNMDVTTDWVVHGVASPVDYVSVPDGLLNYPELDAKGFITQDLDNGTGPVTLDDDGYGIDLYREEYVSSPDWDLVALSNSGSSVSGGSGGSGIHAGDTPPTDKVATPIWFNTVTGKTWTWYDDGDSSQWVQDVAQGEGNILSDNSVDTPQIVDGAVASPKMDVREMQVAGLLPTAWCTFDGNLTGINPPKIGFNVASIERLNSGRYTIFFNSPMDNADYTITLSAQRNSTSGVSSVVHGVNKDTIPTVDGFSVTVYTIGGTETDCISIFVQVFGGLD